MTELWKVEDEIRGKDANIRAAARQERSAAIVANLFDIWEKELAKVSGKSKTAEAIRYAMTRRQSLDRFLGDGRIEIDSNIVERAIRPQTITRKNSLFAGSDVGASYCSSDDVLIIKGDFEPDPEISGAVIAWHRLRGARRRAGGRKVERSKAPRCIAGAPEGRRC